MPGDTNGTWDVFVKDLTDNTIIRVNTDASGNQANSTSGYWYGPAISADGTTVAFHSQASNLVPGDTNGSSDVFVVRLGLPESPNHAPIAHNDTVSVYEDASTLNLWTKLLANDTDVDKGDTLTIVAVDTTNTVGSVTFNPATKTLIYTADDPTQDVLEPGDTDTTSFTYTIRDSAGAEDMATVAVTVQGVLEPKNSGLFVGTSGNDVLQGSPNNDRMNAGAGNDLIIGALGNDIMNGGDGRDTFQLGPNFGHDSIVGFKLGEDAIDARFFFGEDTTHAEVFNTLDQNGDGSIDPTDNNVSFAQGRLTINFDADNSLALIGVQHLTSTEFDYLFV